VLRNLKSQDAVHISPHGLFTWEQPSLFLRKLLRVYPEEVKLLIWVTVIQLVMRVSSILINNFAQTAFLKRFGVESLPTVFLLEALITFFVASGVGVFMSRYRNIRVFTGLFLFFSCAMGVIWLLIPLGSPWVYPVLYILKSQAVELLPILYWDILSDLFTTQQSKRLYTLITAGGVLGTTLGSLMTGTVAHWVGADNVLLIFSGGMVLAVESLSYNPLIKLYRFMTPQMRTEWEKSHILSLKDIEFAKRYFELGVIRYWHITSILSPYAKNFLSLLLSFPNSIGLRFNDDRLLLTFGTLPISPPFFLS